MQYWDDGHMDEGWGIAMMLGIWVLVFAALVLTIVWIVRATRPPQGAWTVPPATSAPVSGSVTGGVTRSAEQILAERLARGDIDTEEYRERLEALTSRDKP